MYLDDIMKIRAFLALEISQKVSNRLSAYAELISGDKKLKQIRWLPIENYQLTLSFLGNVEYDLICDQQLKLEDNLSSSKVFRFRFLVITPFPLSGTPNIV